jgi:hypothetical protein
MPVLPVYTCIFDPAGLGFSGFYKALTDKSRDTATGVWALSVRMNK